MKKSKEFDNLLNILCAGVDDFIDKNNLEKLDCHKKIFAIASFLEFIRMGADVTVLPLQGKEATFIIKLD